jgi:hypothetical protein
MGKLASFRSIERKKRWEGAFMRRLLDSTLSFASVPVVAACTSPQTTVVVDNSYAPSPTSPLVVYQAQWQAVWFQVPLPPGSSSAPATGIPNPPDCPPSFVDLQGDSSCAGNHLRCQYPEAVCECAGNLNGPTQPDGGLSWFCNPDETVPASANTAYAVLAPGWDPTSSTSPTSFVALQSRTGFSVQLGDTLQIPVEDKTFMGNCASKSFLSQSQADLITQRIFPSIFASLRYDPATCTTTPIGDAGGP